MKTVTLYRMPGNPNNPQGQSGGGGGMGIGGLAPVIGAAMDLAVKPIYDNKNEINERHSMMMQIAQQKEMTDYNLKKQLELWEKTGYGPQIEQMKKAGLNPALMYGMGGGGGQTANVAQAPGAKGQTYQEHGVNTAGLMGMGIQMELLRAQKENIEADTALKQTEAAKTGGVDTENVKANTELTRIHREIAQVQASIARQTITDQMQTIENAAKKGTQEIANLKLDAEKTKQETQLLEKEVAQMAIKSALLNAQKENISQDTKNKIQEILESEQRIKSMAQQLMIAWDKLSLETTTNRIAWDDALDKDEGFNMIKELVPTFLIPIGRGFKQGHTPIKGFK